MCKFFSLISDGNGKPYYFNWEQRKKILAKDPEFNKVETADSHSSISSYYGFTGEMADKVNKYEYNPLTGVFTIDQINTTDDKCLIEEFCRKVDFKTIVEPLVIKKIFNPLTDVKAKKVTSGDVLLLKKWSSVRNSVRSSVRDSVWDSVRDSVWDSAGNIVRNSVWNSVWDSVRSSVRDSVWDSVGNSVWDSVGDSVWDSVGNSVWDSAGNIVRNSVWNSVWDSVSTYVDIKYNYKNGISHKLWERGLVPSFDGKKWRLHAGKDAKIVWEGTVDDLNKIGGKK